MKKEDIVPGEIYWVCYDGENAYPLMTLEPKQGYNIDGQQAWVCLKGDRRCNIWSSKMHLTKQEALEESKETIECFNEIHRKRLAEEALKETK